MPTLFASIDIGEINMGLYIGCIKKGKINTCHIEVTSIRSKDDTGKKMLSREGFKNVTKFLHSNILLLDCCFIVIEQQIQGKYNRASVNVRIEQHIQSYFDTINVLLDKDIKIILVDSKDKYRFLNGPIGQTRTIRKKWAITKSIELLLLKPYNKDNEYEFIDCISSSAKASHISDAICQLYAYFKKFNIIQVSDDI